MNTYYAMLSVAELINGYYLPSPTKPGGEAAEFERAKAEYIAVQNVRIELAQAMTLEEFKSAVEYSKHEQAAGM